MSNKKWLVIIGSSLLTIFILAGCGSGEGDKEANVALFGDVITSASVEEAPCVVTSRIEQGQRLIFRAKVEDLDSKEIIEDAKVKLVLGTGEEFDMELGPHGEEGTLLYTVPYEIDVDAPTGVLEYKYVAEVNGEEYDYEPFDVEPSLLTVIEGAEGAAE